ncbi:unnamed protein product [Caenorhabditis nigoni]
MEKQPVIILQFTLKMPRNNQMMSSLNALPVSVEVNETREVESTMANQKMTFGEWIQHFDNETGKRVTVAVLGNDPLWAQDVFHDKIGKSNYFNKFNESISPGDSPDYTVLLTLGLSEIDDVAFSRNFCDIFLLTAPTSSFGWWLAYLAKENSEVYYRSSVELETSSKVQLRVHRCNRFISLGLQGSTPATGTLELEMNKIETFCMIVVVIVLFFIFVGIAAILEYKNSNNSVRQIEETINETTV